MSDWYTEEELVQQRARIDAMTPEERIAEVERLRRKLDISDTTLLDVKRLQDAYEMGLTRSSLHGGKTADLDQSALNLYLTALWQEILATGDELASVLRKDPEEFFRAIISIGIDIGYALRELSDE